MAFQTILYEKKGRIAVVTLNRPEKLNAISQQMNRELDEALGDVEADPGISVVIIKAAGRAFSAGYDITPSPQQGMYQMERSIVTDWLGLMRSGERWMRLWNLPKATIAQVHGHCLAGGNELIGVCDIVIAAEDANIGQPQGRALGIIPTVGLWPLKIGMNRTKELLFTGDPISGKEAERIGLVNKAVPAAELDSYVWQLAERIALTPPEFLAVEKAVVNGFFEQMGIRAAVETGAKLDAIYHATPAAKEFWEIAKERGLKAALEWRDRKFAG